MAGAMNILFAGGGTGGHLFPGIAVAEELLVRDPATRIVFAGSGRPLETAIIGRSGFEHFSLPVESSSVAFRHPIRFLRAWSASGTAAQRILDAQQPCIVVGLGGFASSPLVRAAARRRIPIVLLEQNAIPGRATGFLKRHADRICLAFHATARFLPRGGKCVVTGNPVRGQVAELAARSGPRTDASPAVLLVLGGSQGAHAVNQMMIESLDCMKRSLDGWRIMHQSGSDDLETVRHAYAGRNIPARVEPFFADIAACYASASLVVSRAGATTLAELACAGLPAVLVPYPGSVNDHQRINASLFVACGAACVVEQSAGASRQLADHLVRLTSCGRMRNEMRDAMRSMAVPDAAPQVADVICALAR